MARTEHEPDADAGVEAPASSGREPFVWPPRRVPRDDAPRPEPRPAHTSALEPPAGHPILAAWRAVEEHWLGVTQRSWRSLARDTGWQAETVVECCPRCATSVGPFDADSDGCSVCRDQRLGWDAAIRLGSYEGSLRDAVLAAKYTAWRSTCQQLGSSLGESVRARARELDVPHLAICPVGASARRRLSRGIDHSLVLAREIARVCDAELVRALGRRHRPPQQGRSSEARRRNVAGSFRARPSACKRLGGRTVVLVDDVRTTGATLRAAARELRAGARRSGVAPEGVWVAVVGVTPRENRR